MNRENRCVDFIYHCFVFPSSRKRGGADKYKSDRIYKNIMSKLLWKNDKGVYDLIYRYLIYKRERPIYPSEEKVTFENICHYRFVISNPLWRLASVNKKHDALTLESVNVDLERFDFFIEHRLQSLGNELVPLGNIYAHSLSQNEVEGFIDAVLSLFYCTLEKESYPVKGAFEHIPSIDTLSVIFINLMKMSERDKNSMLLPSNSIAEMFFSLHGGALLLSKDNRLVGAMLQVLVDSIILSAMNDESARHLRKKAIAAIIYGAEQVSLTTFDERLLHKLESLVYSDEHTIEYLSKFVFSSIKSCWWFSTLLTSAKDKKEKVIYLKSVLNSFSMTYQQIDALLQKISSANSTKRCKARKSTEEVKQLIFNVAPSVRVHFEQLYFEKRKTNKELTKKKLITDIIEAEYLKVCRSPNRNSSFPNEKRRQNNSLRMPPWKNKNRHSNNEIQDAPHTSAFLDNVNENGVSTATSEVPQSHQQPTSAELPASDVVENEGQGVDAPNPMIDTSAVLQELQKNLGG
ncbi:hypothetical protein [Aeromonas hydrophila]|uniref:hypothetical protein n=1 Tax=Aeromonas hydrophila TaxID=644 RepID=UPI001117DFE4|nr:hypothetical protein [Aeromonas hydrophila]